MTTGPVRVYDVRLWRSLLCSAEAARALRPSARLVLLVLADCMNPDGSGGYPSLEPSEGKEGRSLVERIGLSRSVVLGHLADAQRAGYVMRTAKGWHGQNATYVPARPEASDSQDPSEGSDWQDASPDGSCQQDERVLPVLSKGPASTTPPRSTPRPTPTDNPAVDDEAVEVTTDERAREPEPPAPLRPVVHEEGPGGWPVLRYCEVCASPMDHRLWDDGERSHVSCDPVAVSS